MRKTLFILMATASVLGCADRELEIGRQLVQTDPNGGAPIVFNITECADAGGGPLENACAIDSTGRTYSQHDGLHTLPAAPPYGAYFLFRPGLVPLAADLSTEGDDASIGVWA